MRKQILLMISTSVLTVAGLVSCHAELLTGVPGKTGAPLTDQQLIAAFAQRHPERAARLLAAPKVNSTGGDVYMGAKWRDRSVANSLRNYPTLSNQLALYRLLYPHAPALCTGGLPAPTALDGLTADQVRAHNKHMSHCMGELRKSTPNVAQVPSHVSGATNPSGDDSNGCSGKHPSPGLFKNATWQGKAFDTPVRTPGQGTRGTCVAFGLIGAMEQSIAGQQGRSVDLSEQEAYAMMKAVWGPDDDDDDGDGYDVSDAADHLLHEPWSVPFEKTWIYNSSPYRQSCQVKGDHGMAANAAACQDGDKGPYFLWSCRADRLSNSTAAKLIGEGGDWYYGPNCSDTTHQIDQTLGLPASPGNSGFRLQDRLDLGDLDDPEDLGAVDVALAGHVGVVACFEPTVDFEKATKQGFLGSGDDGVKGGHCVTVSGIVPAQALAGTGGDLSGSGTFLILKNSWGCDWGDGGYVAVGDTWLSEHLTSLLALVPMRSGTNQLPTVAVSPGDLALFGGNQSVTFSAVANDFEDGDISDRIVWTSDLDGKIAQGASGAVNFKTNGQRVITATATDRDGGQATASFSVDGELLKAQASILEPKPSDASLLVVGQTYRFRGKVVTQDILEAPCQTTAELWSSSLGADKVAATGCEAMLTFLTPGTRTIKLSFGSPAVASATLTVTVKAPVPHGPPTVSVVSPGISVVGHPPRLHLVASVTSTDPILSYKWEAAPAKPNAPWTTIATTATADWKVGEPVIYVGNCGGGGPVQIRVTVTNKNGSGSAISTTNARVDPC